MKDSKTIKNSIVNKNADLIRNLEAFRAYLESRPGLPRIACMGAPIFAYEKEEFVDAVRSMGSGEKTYTEDTVEFTRHFGIVTLYVWGLRDQICQKVQVGVKTVKSYEIKPEFKDQDVMDCVEKEEPVYEWECPESLLSEVEG